MTRRTRFLSAALVATAALSAAPACAVGYARGEGHYEYGGRPYAADVERRAYDTGYREGVEAGESDARHGRRGDFDRHDEWRDADRGYHREYGDRESYRRSFRYGFERGYRESFERFGRGDYRR